MREQSIGDLRRLWMHGKNANLRTAAYAELVRQMKDQHRRAAEALIDEIGVEKALAVMADICEARIDRAKDEGTALRWAGRTDALRQAAEEVSA